MNLVRSSSVGVREGDEAPQQDDGRGVLRGQAGVPQPVRGEQ